MTTFSCLRTKRPERPVGLFNVCGSRFRKLIYTMDRLKPPRYVAFATISLQPNNLLFNFNSLQEWSSFCLTICKCKIRLHRGEQPLVRVHNQQMEVAMPQEQLKTIIQSVIEGQVVPYLGPGVLKDVTETTTGEPIPADSDSLILSLNDGRPMAPKLMYEFPRAAMNVELKRGRSHLQHFFSDLYTKKTWSRSKVHQWLETVMPPYVIDINRDTQLQEVYADRAHTLIRGIARTGGTDYRFVLHHYDGAEYREITKDEIDPSLPVLFKPLGSPVPTPTYIASDADFVDYITELMGGFAIPSLLKRYRKQKQYLFLGMRFTRDTERMVMSDIVYDSGEPTGWLLLEEPTAKEERYCEKMNIEIIRSSLDDFLDATDEKETSSITSAA